MLSAHYAARLYVVECQSRREGHGEYLSWYASRNQISLQVLKVSQSATSSILPSTSDQEHCLSGTGRP